MSPPTSTMWLTYGDGSTSLYDAAKQRAHSALSLTHEQISAWHRAGGSIVTALDASPEMRAAALQAGVLVRDPTHSQAWRARSAIAEALNDAANQLRPWR